MASNNHHARHTAPGIDETAIERSNQVMRQLADAGIKVGGYSLGRKLGRDTPSTESPKQGPLGTIAQGSQLSE